MGTSLKPEIVFSDPVRQTLHQSVELHMSSADERSPLSGICLLHCTVAHERNATVCATPQYGVNTRCRPMWCVAAVRHFLGWSPTGGGGRDADAGEPEHPGAGGARGPHGGRGGGAGGYRLPAAPGLQHAQGAHTAKTFLRSCADVSWVPVLRKEVTRCTLGRRWARHANWSVSTTRSCDGVRLAGCALDQLEVGISTARSLQSGQHGSPELPRRRAATPRPRSSIARHRRSEL